MAERNSKKWRDYAVPKRISPVGLTRAPGSPLPYLHNTNEVGGNYQE